MRMCLNSKGGTLRIEIIFYITVSLGQDLAYVLIIYTRWDIMLNYMTNEYHIYT